MNNPKVSVLLPVFNGEKFLKKSIWSILNQTYKNFELIIIDDGSTDKTSKILGDFKDKRIRIIKNDQNLGVAKSLNIGLSVARGEYIARCDGDDINYKDRFMSQVKFLDTNKEYVLVGSNTEEINSHGKKMKDNKYPETDGQIRQKMIIRNQISHPTAIIRRNVLKKIKGYREIFNGAEDYDLYFRLMEIGKLHNLQKNLVQRRIHPNVVTAKNHLKIELLALIIRLIHLPQLL